MEAIVRTRKVGGSVMVRIPTEILEEEGILQDEVVRIDVEKIRKDWFGAFKGVGSFTHDDELNTHD